MDPRSGGDGSRALEGHTDEVLALALSSDGKILASAGRDRRLGVWDVSGDSPKWVKSFGGHRDIISVSLRALLTSDSQSHPSRRMRLTLNDLLD